MGLLTTVFCTSFQIFNGCPLKINCTASWIHPETRDQHILVGAEEGIYTLNLTELHENAMDLLYPRRTVWMFVIKDVLMTLSGIVHRHLNTIQDLLCKIGMKPHTFHLVEISIFSLVSQSNILQRKKNQNFFVDFYHLKMTLKIRIQLSLRRSLIFLVGLRMTQ